MTDITDAGKHLEHIDHATGGAMGLRQPSSHRTASMPPAALALATTAGARAQMPSHWPRCDDALRFRNDREVTAFTASDFGRSLGINSDGTDHGWGGHHFVIGGGVRGRRVYGAMPSLRAKGNPDDTGYGQIIPTTATDQYAATLVCWLGVDVGGIADVFPSPHRFDAHDLGFLG